ncbi:MAG: hypothetical protein ACFFCW_23870 [Candidatus Hodarchaeota archaeon]
MPTHQNITIYTLTGLLILIVLAILLANMGLFGKDASQSALATWGPAGALANIVALYVYLVKRIFPEKSARRLSLIIVPPKEPEELQHLDLARIHWEDNQCYIKGDNWQENVKLVLNEKTGTYSVHIGENVINKIRYEDPLELSLKDKKGNKWAVRSFFLLTRELPLLLIEDLSKIQQDYGEEY